MRPAAARPSRLSTASWVAYDLANTIFSLGVVGLYFSDWLLAVGQPDSALAAVQIGAAIVVVFLAPWAGARSDALERRTPTLILTTIVAVTATAMLGTGPAVLTLVMLWLAVIGVNTGSVVYDALLVEVSTPQNRGFISGLGVGVGYLGSFIGLGIGVVTLDVLELGHAAAFRALAAAFLVFALPAFFLINEGGGRAGGPVPRLRDVVVGLGRSWRTASEHDGVIRFLVGRFFYTDAINTLITGFLAIFVIDELGLSREILTGMLATAIGAAVVGGLAAGWVVGRWGPLRALRAALTLWGLAIASGVTAAATGRTSIVWVIGPVGGAALGAVWASDRVVMTRICPPRRLGELYGLYATVGRFAAIAGPLLWAVAVDGLGLGRTFALAALGALIAVAWWILGAVDDSERDWPVEDRLTPARPPGA